MKARDGFRLGTTHTYVEVDIDTRFELTNSCEKQMRLDAICRRTVVGRGSVVLRGKVALEGGGWLRRQEKGCCCSKIDRLGSRKAGFT